ncbi:hypothetical protein RUND412_007181 [Rhizina undulata]
MSSPEMSSSPQKTPSPPRAAASQAAMLSPAMSSSLQQIPSPPCVAASQAAMLQSGNSKHDELWFCCKMVDSNPGQIFHGPWLTAIVENCLGCEHVKCDKCSVELLEDRMVSENMAHHRTGRTA